MPFPEEVGRLIAGDGADPRAERGVVVKLREAVERLGEDIVDKIFGIGCGYA